MAPIVSSTKPALVERVGVDRDLNIEVGRRRSEASVDGRTGSCPSLRAVSGRRHRLESAPPAARAGLLLPLPRMPTLTASPSKAWSMRIDVPGARACRSSPRCRWRIRCRRRSVVVIPQATATSTCCGQMKWMCVSMPPAVTILPSPAMTSVRRPDDRRGSTPHCVKRVARLADGDDPPGLDADVPLDDAPLVDDDGVGDDQVAVSGAHRLSSGHWACRREWTCRRQISIPRRSCRSASSRSRVRCRRGGCDRLSSARTSWRTPCVRC